MARIVGRRGGLWALGLLGLAIVAPLSLYAPLAGAFALAAAGGSAALLAHRRATRLAARCEKLSGEFDVLSQRLLRLESVTRIIADQQVRAAEAGAPPPIADDRETADLVAGVEEVTAEIGLLSGIVRELAAVVAAQDDEIAGLKAAPRFVAPEIPPPVRAAVPPPPLVAEIAAPKREPSGSTAPWTPRSLAFAAAAPERDLEREAALLAAFDGTGLEVHLQPIVSLPQRRVVSYEALARLRVAGETLAPDVFLPLLERHGRTTDLDRRMLQRVATIARHLAGRGSQAAVAYGLSPRSLFEPGFLRSLGHLIAGEPDLSGRLVVALPQTSWRSLDAEQAKTLGDLRGRIGFVLDRPVDLRLDPLALADRGISQVKVPADLLLRPGAGQAMPDIALEDLVAALGRAGIRLVADGVERESDVPDLIDLDVPMAQGSVFAPARVVRAEVLAASPSPPEPPPAPAGDDPEPPPQRRPFRDFLRRAG
ncbi:EAL domain-containing protein [Methylobacterium sp. BTF04]|uniref:EAL domain-containing protein n=1 Tax=Methylobacterium sp. BTF04 TaxID=2708300 RepID=UPI0013D69817|nr:EAL domain-containing protein [Methylobacterium sp. BTF04]NEU10605.1 EAL domain-containing protein [Methylobacterium sp. BTF04]